MSEKLNEARVLLGIARDKNDAEDDRIEAAQRGLALIEGMPGAEALEVRSALSQEYLRLKPPGRNGKKPEPAHEPTPAETVRTAVVEGAAAVLLGKRCSKCGETKALTEFTVSHGKPRTPCKACAAAYAAEYWRKKHPPKERALEPVQLQDELTPPVVTDRPLYSDPNIPPVTLMGVPPPHCSEIDRLLARFAAAVRNIDEAESAPEVEIAAGYADKLGALLLERAVANAKAAIAERSA